MENQTPRGRSERVRARVRPSGGRGDGGPTQASVETMSDGGGKVAPRSSTECETRAPQPPEASDDSRGEMPPPAAAPGENARTPVTAAPADAVLGQVVWLMLHVPGFRHFFLADLEWMVLPPILLNQYRLFREGNRVVAFAAWGYLSEEAEARLQRPDPRLSPTDWKSGDRHWLVHLVAPFGHTELVLKDLQATALAGRRFSYHRIGADGNKIAHQIDTASGS
jgi:cytolysin-activating lysine-acyltransferase